MILAAAVKLSYHRSINPLTALIDHQYNNKRLALNIRAYDRKRDSAEKCKE